MATPGANAISTEVFAASPVEVALLAPKSIRCATRKEHRVGLRAWCIGGPFAF
ncbi:MAG: hypothetical protein WBC44_15345 [Planctomycetaceae bacterium]